MVHGSCLCGDLAFEIGGALELMSHCHCSRCRKAHGAPFATYVGASADAFRWTRRSREPVRYASSPSMERAFCARCGSVVPAPEPGAERVFLPAGLLDDDPGTRPVAHIFTASRAPWYEITDSLPRFDAYPPGYETPEIGAEPDRPSSEAGIARGSCLCGRIAFEAPGASETMVLCHCSRCRKSRAAAHHANLIATPDGFRWLRGEDLRVDFKLPGADRFGTGFCRECGSLLPRPGASPDRLMIPAGTIDGDPGARPRMHIFVGSKAPWFDITDDLPQHAEYPA